MLRRPSVTPAATSVESADAQSPARIAATTCPTASSRSASSGAPLPISSSGHLILVPDLLGWNDFAGDPALSKAFDVALHLGTLVGACWYFRHDLARYLAAAARSIPRRSVADTDARVAWLLLLSAVPGAIVGALLSSTIDEHLGAPVLIGVMLIIGGLLLSQLLTLYTTPVIYLQVEWLRQKMGFGARRAASAARGRLRGLGFGCHLHGTGGIADEHAIIQVTPEKLIAHAGTQSQGQGHETVFAQVVASVLGVPLEHIELRQGDSRTIPHGGGTGGSSDAFAALEAGASGTAMSPATRPSRLIAAMIFSRTPVTERARKTTPLTKTMPRASCQGTPRAPQIVKVKNALMPMPGASAIG